MAWGSKPATAGVIVVGLLLAGSTLAAVHHAEVVAHRVGEPFGSLVLAVAVTIIEVALIVTLMVAGGDGASTLARDTVFAAVMITLNGIIGISLLSATLRTRVASFSAEGTGTALATVGTLATLTLVVPTFTTGSPGLEFTTAQLIFASVASIVLYGSFVFVQTVRHRDYFLPRTPVVKPTAVAGASGSQPGGDDRGAAAYLEAMDAATAGPATQREVDRSTGDSGARDATGDGSGTTAASVDRDRVHVPLAVDPIDDDDEHADPPTDRETWISLALLLVSLVAVVGLAKIESPAIEDAVASIGAPQSAVGVVIALLVLLPESIAAVNAARRDRLQVSFNLGFGSAMASIGLTIPVIAIASIWLSGPLELGLEPVQIVLLVITLIASVLTVVPGRATLQQAVVHLSLLGAFLFLAVSP
jgi:Ca2+:H+ antiporter